MSGYTHVFSKIAFLYNRQSVQMRMILCFVIVIIYTLFFLSGNISKWEIFPDTLGYWNVQFSDPWGSGRTPGLGMYVKALGQYEASYKLISSGKSDDELTKIALNDDLINDSFKYIANANYLLMSISIALLSTALACHIHLAPAVLIPIIFLSLTNLPPPRAILADPLAAILTILFTAFGLFFLKNKKLIFLFLASLCAAYAFLVKPAMIFLAVIAGVLILISFIYLYNDLFKRIKVIFIGIIFIACTLIWPVLLYMKGGVLATSQLSSTTKNMFAMYLLQPGDDMLFSDIADKELVAELLRQKPNIDHELDESAFPEGREYYSNARIYSYSVNTYGYVFFPSVFRQVRPDAKTNSQEWAKISKSICEPIIHAHFIEYAKVVARSFLSAYSRYPDCITSPFSIKFLGKIYQYQIHLIIFIGMYFVIFSAILLGHKPLKYPIIFVACLHPLAVFFCSIGHAVLERYVETTEWSLLLSFMLAILSLWVKVSQGYTIVIVRKNAFEGKGDAA